MQKYTAIILASREIGEVNRLYFLYTLEQGLVKAVAKGARKPTAKLAGHLEPGTVSEVYIARSRGMGQITGAITLENFENIKKDFARISEVLKIFHFFLKNFSEGEKDEKVFKLLCDFLTRVGLLSNDKSPTLVVEAFWWKLFDVLGHRPEVMKCIVCREKLRGQRSSYEIQSLNQGSTLSSHPFPKGRDFSKSNLKFFSMEKGGTICSGCSQDFKGLIPISDNQIKLLRIFLGNPFEKIAKIKINEAEFKKLSKIREIYSRYYFS